MIVHLANRVAICRMMVFWLLLVPFAGFNQDRPYQNEPIGQSAIDTIDKNRLLAAYTLAGTAYTASSIALYKTWYRDFPQSGFHFYDDWGEWNQMDKMGHIYSGYFQADLAYKAARWTGMQEKKALLAGSISALLFQSTVEVMDGFSTNWGFSITDQLANVVGIGGFGVQQAIWGEQRLRWKFSSFPRTYSPAALRGQDIVTRAEMLYGTGVFERTLKDYNTQTVWLSVNPRSFLPASRFPKWLNIAVGYGADNLYGGFDNAWEVNGEPFTAFEEAFPRYRQFYLSLDIDFSRIPVKSPFLKTVFDLLNVLKMPFSALEINTLGEIKFKIIHF